VTAHITVVSDPQRTSSDSACITYFSAPLEPVLLILFIYAFI